MSAKTASQDLRSLGPRTWTRVALTSEASVRAQFKDQRLRGSVNWRDVDGARDAEATFVP